MKKLLIAACLLAGACAHRPLVVESGTSWRLPLVDPLTRAALVVPVFLDGKGPYLFALAPHLPRTVLDDGVARELGWDVIPGMRALTQRDHTVPVRAFEIHSLETGELRARHVIVVGARAGSLVSSGRPLAGLLGGDLLSSSMVIDVDRDRGLVSVSVAGHEDRLPEGAKAVPAESYRGQLLVPARVDGRPLELAIDFTATHSAARGAGGARAVNVVDEFGVAQEAGVERDAKLLVIDGVAADVNLVDFVDRRVLREEYDGVVGQDFLSRSRVIVDAHRGRLWLSARAPDLGDHAADRIARWGADFAACAADGCASVERRGDELTVTPAVAYRVAVTLQALDEEQRPIDAPLLRVTGERATTVPLAAVYRPAALLRVVDVTPVYESADPPTATEGTKPTPPSEPQ